MLRRIRPAHLVLSSFAALLALCLSYAAFAFPEPDKEWLTRKQTDNGTPLSDAEAQREADEYYRRIRAPVTFGTWKLFNGFVLGPDVRAVYFNHGDLGLGRDMNCVENGPDIACYVVNYGIAPGSPPGLALEDAIRDEAPLAVVAMVYHGASEGHPNDVTFYVYGPNDDDPLIETIALDSQGVKPVPFLCLACHGGTYNAAANSVSDASFLPFDTAAFGHSFLDGFKLEDQQEAFRRLNVLVRKTYPAPQIVTLIDTWYASSGGVDAEGSTLDEEAVVPGYAGDPGLYRSVVKPYCRSCHIAQGIGLASPAEMNASRESVFSTYDMPHAEQTLHNFWSSQAPAYLASTRQGWAIHVTRRDDPRPAVCTPTDCSLRGAIIAANGNPDHTLITFDIDGTFELRGSFFPPEDNFALFGDLDVRADLTLLGNGADRTIIDANRVGRVFHILNGARVVIQGVTVRGGRTNGLGGGILNQEGRLSLRYSVVTDNIASQGGGGIANLAFSDTEVEFSTLGPANQAPNGRGGGLLNDGSAVYFRTNVRIEASTISGNVADEGGGIANKEDSEFSENSTVTQIRDSTITGNVAQRGAAGVTSGDDRNSGVSLARSIVAGNQGRDCNDIFSNGGNLFGRNGDPNGCVVRAGDIVLQGPIETALQPALTFDEGGLPQHALVPGSPALDALSVQERRCGVPSYDQRNVARPVDGNGDGLANCDIGAYEARFELNVTTQEDVVADDGKCSLREAIETRNTGRASGNRLGECFADPTVRVLNLGVPGPYRITGGHLRVTSEIVLRGHDRTIRRAAGNGRLFFVTEGGSLTLSDMTLQGGRSGGDTSDIYSGGALFVASGAKATLTNITFSDNVTTAAGGAIASRGELHLDRSTLQGNRAEWGGGVAAFGRLDIGRTQFLANRAQQDGGAIHIGLLADSPPSIVTLNMSDLSGNVALRGDGGAISSDSQSDLTVTTTTFRGNSAGGSGGGVRHGRFFNPGGGRLRIVNSTLSGNTANVFGGGLDGLNGSFIDLLNVTLADNAAQTGGSLALFSASAAARNTIFARSRHGGECSPSLSLTGNNMDSDGTCLAGSDPSNLPNTDARLERLADNGGPTLTHALPVDSPAIDAGDAAACPSTDQRGEPRPVDGNGDGIAACDIGAYEAPAGLAAQDFIPNTIPTDPATSSATPSLTPEPSATPPLAPPPLPTQPSTPTSPPPAGSSMPTPTPSPSPTPAASSRPAPSSTSSEVAGGTAKTMALRLAGRSALSAPGLAAQTWR